MSITSNDIRALMKECRMENVKCKMDTTIPHSTFSILNSIAEAAFLIGWAVAIVSHII